MLTILFIVSMLITYGMFSINIFLFINWMLICILTFIFEIYLIKVLIDSKETEDYIKDIANRNNEIELKLDTIDENDERSLLLNEHMENSFKIKELKKKIREARFLIYFNL